MKDSLLYKNEFKSKGKRLTSRTNIAFKLYGNHSRKVILIEENKANQNYTRPILSCIGHVENDFL